MSTRASSSASPSCVWADLPPEILEMLVTTLPSFFDRLRLAAVCRSWREVAEEVKRDPTCRRGISCLPVLTFIESTGKVGTGSGGHVLFNKKKAFWNKKKAAATAPVTRCFYSLCEDRVYRLRQALSKSYRCFGSSRGWLGFVDHRTKIFLYNPVSRQRVDLPPLTTLPGYIPSMDKEQLELYLRVTRELHKRLDIDSLCLSSSPLDPSCIVMATVTQWHFPAYTRPGDECWVELFIQSYRDIVYHDDRFYLLPTRGKIKSLVFVIEELRNPKLRRVHVYIRSEVPPTTLPSEDLCSGSDKPYFVALPSGDTLQFNRYVNFPDCRRCYLYETNRFLLYKMKNDGTEWMTVDDIGRCCPLSDPISSMAFPTCEALGKHGTNCTFSDFYEESCVGRDSSDLDHGVYHLKKNKFFRHLHTDARTVFPEAMWINLSLS